MTRPPISTGPMSDSARVAAGFALASATLFVVLLAALHALRRDLDPAWRFISEYELGRHAWMMQLAFVALAASCIALGIAILSQIRTIAGYLGLAMLAISAIGMLLAGIFVTDPMTATPKTRTPSGRIHEVSAMLDLIPFAALLIASGLARNARWASQRRSLLWTRVLPLAGTILFVISMAILLPRNDGMLGPEVRVGWANRLMIVSHAAWVVIAAWCALRVSARRGVDRARAGELTRSI